MVEVKVKKLNPAAIIPKKAKAGDACYDLCALTFEQRADVVVVGTGLAFAIPEGYEGVIRSRSGLGSKGIFVSHGVGTIDAGYRGEVMVLLSSLGRQAHLGQFGKSLVIGNTTINIGDRVAQMGIREVPETEMIEVEELDQTERGDTGFGSSGLQSVPEAKKEGTPAQG